MEVVGRRNRKQTSPRRSCLDSALHSAGPTKAAMALNALFSHPAKPTAVPHKQQQHLADDLMTLDAKQDNSAPMSAHTAAAAAVDAKCHLKTSAKQPSSSSKSPSRSISKVARKPGLCDFCGETDSPMWRRGPEKFPHLCNACGMRGTRYAKQDKDAFTPQVRASVMRKRLAIAAKAAAAPEAPTGKPGKTTGGTNQPKPKPERKRKPPTAPAALDPNNGSPAGKRPRKATPKAQLLEVLRQEQEAWAALKAEMDAAQAAEEQEQEEKEGMQFDAEEAEEDEMDDKKEAGDEGGSSDKAAPQTETEVKHAQHDTNAPINNPAPAAPAPAAGALATTTSIQQAAAAWLRRFLHVHLDRTASKEEGGNAGGTGEGGPLHTTDSLDSSATGDMN